MSDEIVLAAIICGTFFATVVTVTAIWAEYILKKETIRVKGWDKKTAN